MLLLFQYLRSVVQRFLLIWRPVKSKPAKPTTPAETTKLMKEMPDLFYRWQKGLEELGFGSQNCIYRVDDHIVLKGRQTFSNR